MERRNGITVLELLIVVVIVGVTTTTAIIASKNITSSMLLNSTSNKIAAFIERISLRAVESQQTFAVTLSAGTVYASKDGIIRESFLLPVSVKLVSIKPKNIIQFYKSGAATPSVIILSNGEKQCAIIISLRTRVTNSCRA